MTDTCATCSIFDEKFRFIKENVELREFIKGLIVSCKTCQEELGKCTVFNDCPVATILNNTLQNELPGGTKMVSGIDNEERFWNEKFNQDFRMSQSQYDYLTSLQAQPSVLYRPRIFKEGDRWCALYGENPQYGVCAYGETPDKAVSNFNTLWREGEINAR